MPTTLNRRTFFRGTTLGLGGAYLSTFLSQLDSASAADATPKRPRVLFFVQGNGLYPAEIQPDGIERTKNPTNIEDRPLAGHALSDSLAPLAPWRERMTILNGLSGRVARGSHNMGFAALGCWPMGKHAFGETVDAGLARNLGGIFPHVGLGVSNRVSAMEYNVTSKSKGLPLPTLMNPVLAHRHFFAAGAEGTARAEFNVKTGLLDFMADDVKRVRLRLDSSEQEKLDRYLGAFESMSARQSRLAQMSKEIREAAPSIDPKTGTWSAEKGTRSGCFDRLDAQFQIAAGTLAAGLTNVVTVSAEAGPDRIGLSCLAEEVGVKGGGYIGSHGIGHGGSVGNLSASDCHALIRKRCMQSLAGALEVLDSLPEGDGTVLDNTLVVYLSDSAEGHHPVCKEWPFVLIGDLGGRLRTGDRYLRYPAYGTPKHRTINSLYLTLLRAVGDRSNSFGLPDLEMLDVDQSGVLEELLV